MKKISDERLEGVFRALSNESANLLKEKIEDLRLQKQKTMDKQVEFYMKEVEFLQFLPNEKIKRLFYSLLCFEKLYWHESGWIRFEIDELEELCGLKNLKCEDFSDLVPFGFNMRVTGSKKAVTTYYSIHMMIQEEFGGAGSVIKIINGLECAGKFLEVLHAANR